MLRVCSLLVLSLVLSGSVASADVSGQARVVDGDTLIVAEQTVRLFGIDAPEMAQTCETPHGTWPCGRWAQGVLAGLATGPVACVTEDTDR